MPQFSSQGVCIDYEVRGEGPPILLIHGFASNARANWIDTGWVETLADNGRQVIVFDHRGHGNSEKLYRSELYTTSAMAEDARALLDHLHIARADVMGYSMGARVAARLAIDHPERVGKLILAGLAENMINGVAGAQEIAAALEAENPDEVRDPHARPFRLFADATKSDRRALAACIRTSRQKISAEELGRISAPTLIVVGGKDEIAGRPEPLQAVIPGAEILVVPDRDHMRTVGDRRYKQGVLAFLEK
ncbi:alpha/beta fold hydrolase [Rhodoligotrophos defluvii]|uniref:alpha/beta fold hydrolase n=1 Tax=Rhodoligotrophos defluvii TaxID=2561934 RepID=UPI0010C9878A|nr:alpha/beta hydrolase [Rhodoligotrophos defluvii]